MTLIHGYMPWRLVPRRYRGAPKPFSAVASHLRTGDLLFCSEARKRSSQIIRFFTYSPYTHIAMLVRDPTPAVRATWSLPRVPGGDDAWDGCGDDVYVFEAAPPECTLVNLRDWLETAKHEYPDEMLAVRQLDLRGVAPRCSRLSEHAEHTPIPVACSALDGGWGGDAERPTRRDSFPSWDLGRISERRMAADRVDGCGRIVWTDRVESCGSCAQQ